MNPIALIFAMLLAALISLALALPALRVRGEYFVAASLGLQMLAITVFTEWKSVTGGIGGRPPYSLSGDDPDLNGAIDEHPAGFTVQEAEVALQAVVDPYLRGDIFITIANLQAAEERLIQA